MLSFHSEDDTPLEGRQSESLIATDQVATTPLEAIARTDAAEKETQTSIASQAQVQPNSKSPDSSKWRSDAHSYTHHRGYNFSPGPKTRNGVLWSTIRRGTIVRMRDVRRYWATDKKVGDEGIVEGPGGLWMDKDRYFLIKDRYSRHADTRAIYTNGGQGLKNKCFTLKTQSMCIQPHSGLGHDDWVNGAPNDFLKIKWTTHLDRISPLSSVIVTQSIAKDMDEEFHIVGEIEEDSMDKLDTLEDALRRESRA